jgi:hypothetical protein
MKILVTAILLSLLSLNFAAAEDGESNPNYDKAYSDCSAKADTAGNDYDKVFAACMTEKGFKEYASESKSGAKTTATKPAEKK